MKLGDLVNLDELRELCESFSAVTGVATSVVDVEGNHLISAGWQSICTRFHRVHPETVVHCRESKAALSGQLGWGVPYKIYKCKNGMIDVVMPIWVAGEHIANLFTGQFLFEPPDEDFFVRRAKLYGFDEAAYLDALRRVPVIPEEKVKRIIEHLTRLARLMGEMGLARKRLEDTNRELRANKERLEEQISERKSAEHALVESEQFLNDIIENIPNMIFVKNAADLAFVRFNKAGERLLGHPREYLIGKNDYDFFPKNEADFFTAKDRETLNALAPIDIPEERIQTRFLGERILHTKKIPILNDAGAPRYLLGISEDITERKRIDEALRASEERYRLLFESESDAIILIDAQTFRHFDSNQAALNLYGYSRDEMLALRYTDLATDSEKAAEQIRSPCETIRVPLCYHWKKDGTVFPVEFTGRFFDWRKRRHLLVAVRDISERLQAEEQRKMLENQLIHSQKMESVGRLAGGIAHDFNNMLTPIMGYAEILQQDLPSDDPRRSSAAEIITAVLRLRDLVHQLLAFARRQTLEMKPADLNGIIDSFEPMLRRTLHENIALELRLTSALGMIRADVGQIEQILLNLAVNAQDAMPEGGSLFIETSLATLDEAYIKSHKGVFPGPYVMMAVSDTGVGMDQAIIERVFEPFFTTKASGKGVGLGLSTVYGIVKQHEGHILLSSEPGRGTLFRVYFPCCEETIPPVTQIGKRDESQKQTPGWETLLVVEDQPHVRELTTIALQRCGYQVLAVDGMKAALRVAASHEGPIHILITDVMLPDGNGQKLHERLAATDKVRKVLFMSGYTSEEIDNHVALRGGVHFIQKPFSLLAFTRKVREVLDQA